MRKFQRNDNDRMLALLLSISDDVSKLRDEVQSIQAALSSMGAFDPKHRDAPKPPRGRLQWNPPLLKRLGDIVTILAKSNPVAAEALAKLTDTALDPSRDPRVDTNVDTGGNNVDKTDNVDPRLRDRDQNKRDIFSFDPDPTKKDQTITAKDKKDVGDDTRDDSDGVGTNKPDTVRDPDGLPENPT